MNKLVAEPRGGFARAWTEWRAFVLFIAIMLVFRSAIADWNQVPTGSMLPSIVEGDRIVVDKLAYDLRVPFTFIRIAQWADPARSDVITFESPLDGTLLVKRVIGIPGDVVELRANQLIINGEPARYQTLQVAEIPEHLRPTVAHADFDEEQVLGTRRSVMRQRAHGQSRASFGPLRVPPGSYLVLGDNRDNSQDFRVIGFVERGRVLGRASSIAFSLDYDNYYAPRSERFFKPLL